MLWRFRVPWNLWAIGRDCSRPRKRQAAAKVLGKLGDRRAIGPLIKALGDFNEGVRGEAAEAIGKLRDSESVDLLVQALNTQYEVVAHRAVQSFFEMTGTTREDHYGRYDLVIHLESASVRVPERYVRYPQAHRPEDVQQAALLDELLGELWAGHPSYFKMVGRADIEDKLAEAMKLIEREVQ